MFRFSAINVANGKRSERLFEKETSKLGSMLFAQKEISVLPDAD
jgi:hypothetical protein